MDQAGIQSKISRGYGIAARYLGATFTQYRPNGPANPISDDNQIGTLKAAFDPNAAFTFGRPSLYGKPIYYGLFDPTNVTVGDYLVHPDQGTFFLAGFEPIKPPMCVQCNRVLTFTRPGAPAKGPNAYGGPLRTNDMPLLQAWPASVVKGLKGDRPELMNPGDLKQGWVEILIPAVGGVELLSADEIVDEQATPLHYTISSVELTSLGYRIQAALAVT